MCSKKSSVSRFMALRRPSLKSGYVYRSGVRAGTLRRYNHWPTKLSTSACERLSASIRRTCVSSTSGVLEPSLRREVEQLVVGNAAPQEERQTGRELDIAHVIDIQRDVRGGACAGRHVGRIGFRAEEKLGAHEQSSDRQFDTCLESAGRVTLLVEPERSGQNPQPSRASDRRAGSVSRGWFLRTPALRRDPPGSIGRSADGSACRPARGPGRDH